jgi:leucyl/phenylalanyl-tRNA--protein transferase
LKRTLKKEVFEIRINSAFRDVMAGCARRKETWISPVIRDSYLNLHNLGLAHSVEAWHKGKLVGGLYGVAVGGAFFGESMYHEVTDASKVALYALVQRLRTRGFTLLDTQWTTPHLKSFGAYEVPRRIYLERLKAAIDRECAFVDSPALR